MVSRSNELSALEVLGLIFVDVGLRTSYELQSMASMSVGLGRPVLERLQDSGAVELLTENGPRGSRPYVITDRGRELLAVALEGFRADEHWLETHQHLSFDAIPRCAFIEWIWGDGVHRQKWRDAVHRSIQRRGEDLEKNRRRILRDLQERLQTLAADEPVTEQPIVALVYSLMQITFAAQVLKTQAGLVDQLIEEMEKVPAATLGSDKFLEELMHGLVSKRASV